MIKESFEKESKLATAVTTPLLWATSLVTDGLIFLQSEKTPIGFGAGKGTAVSHPIHVQITAFSMLAFFTLA
jgi:hypothetical protein